MKSRTLMALSAGLCLVMFSGCATSSDIDRLEKQIVDVRFMASEARDQAKAAKNAADEANTRSQRTEEMLNRSFQKSMRK